MKKFLAEKVRSIYKEGEGFWDIPNYLKISKWPKVMYDGEMEDLDTENFSWMSITDDELVICCGGDWQDPMEVVIRLINDKLTVVDSYSSDFEDGLEEDEFNELLFGTSDYDKIILNK